jgi:hypothetical protein
MRQIIGPVRFFKGHFSVGTQSVRAEIKPVRSGKEDIPVGKDVAKGNLLGLRKLGRIRPAVTVVLGKIDPPFPKRKRPPTPLGVNVKAIRLKPIPKMLGLLDRGPREPLFSPKNSDPAETTCR